MQAKTIHLVGGVPKFDLTVMDFERWGTHGAAPRLRQVLHDGMNIMDRCEIYARPGAGREHHKSWFQDVDHPDMRLMATAPELLVALVDIVKFATPLPHGLLEQARAPIAKATMGAA